MALRADTARHFIVGATVVIFSAAAIGTAMRYQDRSPATDLTLTAELPAREASAAARFGLSEPLSYRDGARGSGTDVATRLETTSAAASNGGGGWSNRERGRDGNGGSATWWAGTSARLTPTSSRRHGAGAVSMPGSGYAVMGGARANRPAAAAAAPGRARGNGRNGGGSGGGGGTAPVFGDHTTPVGELVDSPPVTLDDGPGNPGGGLDPGGLAHSPEPASLLLMATGVIGVIGAARRRRR